MYSVKFNPIPTLFPVPFHAPAHSAARNRNQAAEASQDEIFWGWLAGSCVCSPQRFFFFGAALQVSMIMGSHGISHLHHKKRMGIPRARLQRWTSSNQPTAEVHRTSSVRRRQSLASPRPRLRMRKWRTRRHRKRNRRLSRKPRGAAADLRDRRSRRTS